MAGTRGLLEVPIKLDPGDAQYRRLLVEMRESIVKLRATQAPLPTPSNFRATALPFGVLLQWTRVTGADYYEVLWNTSADATKANVQGVGDSAQYIDQVGQSGIKRFYWLRARKFTGAGSALNGPLSATTLVSTPGVTPPAPPPPGQIIVIDQQTGHQVYYVPFGSRRGSNL